MEAEAVRALLGDLESDRVERTVSTSDTDKFAEAICAFSNDFPQNRLPGYLIIGADDRTGRITGIQITGQLLTNLGGIRSDGNVQPLPAMSVQKFTFPEGDLAVVEVHPSDLPPVRYKGRVWIRVGPRRAEASEYEERLLSERRVSSARTFDALPCREASIEDLSLRLFEFYRSEAVAAEIIAENHRTIEQQLASLRFLDAKVGVPTHAGLLLFGTNPRFFLPGAYIQYLQLPGRDITDVPIDQAEIDGDLRSVLEELLLRMKVVNSSEMHTTSEFKEQIRSKYPEIALREILLNAIVHRNYESTTPIRVSVFPDRIEITSPGGLYGEVNRLNFRTQSSYRNPVLAEALKILGFVNRFGYGLRRAERALLDGGSRPLDFTIEDGAILVTIWALGGDMKTVAFFNNKGGVGKTSLIYHLAWMFADRGLSTVAIDLDPQANLTAMFLDESKLEGLFDSVSYETVYGCIQPLIKSTGDVAKPQLQQIAPNLSLIAGDLRLSKFEDLLSEKWPKAVDGDEAAFRVLVAFNRIVNYGAVEAGAEIVLMDVGPNLGAINRSALLSASDIVIPLGPDLYSLQGLKNLGPTLRDWRGGWTKRIDAAPSLNFELPAAECGPLDML